MKNKSLVSINDYTKEQYQKILDLAEEFEVKTTQKILENYVVATLFFEPSTRTRLSFESAASRLGAKVIGFSDSASTSVKKGESLKDTIKKFKELFPNYSFTSLEQGIEETIKYYKSVYPY